MSSCNQSCFVTSVVFNGINHMHAYLLVIRTRIVTLSFIEKGFIVIDLFQFDCLCVLPSGITILTVKLHSLVMVSWYQEAIHVDGFHSERVKLRLVGTTNYALLCIGELSECW